MHFHLIHLNKIEVLAISLCACGVHQVFHGADMDLDWLQRDLGVYVVNMFDTGQASRVLSLPKFSLAYLLQNYCNVQADKQYQLADWRIR